MDTDIKTSIKINEGINVKTSIKINMGIGRETSRKISEGISGKTGGKASEKISKKITEYIAQGISQKKGLGVELEHFVCDAENRTASYETIAGCMREVSESYHWELQYVEGHILGMKCAGYYLSLEPASQLEISIMPQSDISVIETVYDSFREIWDRILAEKGYHFVTKGVNPLVESGCLLPDDIGMIP